MKIAEARRAARKLERAGADRVEMVKMEDSRGRTRQDQHGVQAEAPIGRRGRVQRIFWTMEAVDACLNSVP